MPFSLRQIIGGLFAKPQTVPAPLDPLAPFRMADGSLAVKIETCVFEDGSMVVKAPRLHGFAIGFKNPPDEDALKTIISVAFKQKLKLSHNISEDFYSFEFKQLPDKNGYTVRVAPLTRPQLPANKKL